MKFIVDWKEVERVKNKIDEVPKKKGVADALNNTYNTLYIALMVLEHPENFAQLAGVVDWAVNEVNGSKGRLYRLGGISTNSFWAIKYE